MGNGDGLITYDGARWSYDVVPLDSSGAREPTMRAVAYDEGRLYMGLVDAFGYADLTAGATYRSLSDAVPEAARPIGAVWSVGRVSNAVFFLADDYVYRIPLLPDGTPQPGEVRVLSPDEVRDEQGELVVSEERAVPFLGFALDDRFYVHLGGVGLCVATADGLRLVPNGGRLAGTGVFGVVPIGEAPAREVVVVTSDALYRYDGSRMRPFTGPFTSVSRGHPPTRRSRCRTAGWPSARGVRASSSSARRGNCGRTSGAGRGCRATT